MFDGFPSRLFDEGLEISPYMFDFIYVMERWYYTKVFWRKSVLKVYSRRGGKDSAGLHRSFAGEFINDHVGRDDRSGLTRN